MNYDKHYDLLINRAKSRSLEGQFEQHHIIPKCRGGDDSEDNIVCLTPEEHYVAHQLLACIFPEHPGLIHAAVKMAKQCTGNKAYGWLRRRHIEALRNRTYLPEWKTKISEAKQGKKRRPFSAAHLAKLSEASKGKSYPGWKHSSEAKAAMSLAHKGKPKTPEWRERIGLSQRGVKRPYMIERNKARSGIPLSAAHRAKLSLALRGKKKPAGFGAKIGAYWRGRKRKPNGQPSQPTGGPAS